jgi:DNA phosphorothioation-dependent restriction protein DptG
MDVDENGVKDFLGKLLVEIQEINKRLEYLNNKTNALGKSLHKAFIQIREAMGSLREDMSEGLGTMIEDSWLD